MSRSKHGGYESSGRQARDLPAPKRQAMDERSRIAAIRDLLPPECWVYRVPATELSCLSLLGATFPNGTAFPEDACCLPCRIRAAIDDTPAAPNPRDARVAAEPQRAKEKS